ncbi:MAG TPA: alpha/beta hydrolase [Opitutus sp.]|nr:alpha/beta hydrolase [Opitutus sp.]
MKLPDGTKLSLLYLPNPHARFTLWHFHGNAEALDDILPRLNELREFGFSVFALEYPGYGTSEGTPTEAEIYRSLDAGLKYLHERLKVRPEDLVVHGRSLGGGPAVELASRENVAGLILESAFVSAYRVMTRWSLLPGDKFNNLSKMPRVSCPVLVIHGREDRVVPFRHGQRLFASAPSKMKRHLWVDFADHNDLQSLAGELYRNAIVEFAKKL